ncbi:DHA2 family efflux MFS transporter permease subunit [Streptomyces sp. HUCO-GS316]|uniref:MFS transporter n=1 Tax=Streptomyces sp. HUCO-GS316 TaxID=2692198 RepID=UPI001370DFDC|nr:MFS transporter [Streptomyces sp. HUCO-GS316]MXM66384.1 DHA2 family efflux MFS transporter permease subunit [Streptomyces sp. HUCO-GS316]
MSSAVQTGASPGPVAAAGFSRRPVLALLVIAAAELMVVLDATIVNIALPSIQSGLDMSDGNLAWVVNAYAVTFGGLMLLGGRAGDLFGRRRVFRLGIVTFVLASVLGGLAPNEALLICARVLQGVGAAVAAPTALALIATNFPEGKQRNRAMGAYAAMAGVGSVLGLILGGLLTEYLDWRWVLLVNIPIGIAVLAGTTVLEEADRDNGRLDLAGAAVGTAGLLCLIYGVTRGGQTHWTGLVTAMCLAVAAVLLVLFMERQARIAHPMLPLRILKDRSRAGTYAALLLTGFGMFSTFYFLTFYMQHVLDYGAVRTGLAYLPFSVGIGMTAPIASKLVVKLPPRWVAGPGLVVAATGMFWLSRLTPHSSYTATLMPAMFVTAAGLGCAFVPLTLGAVRGVDEADSGSASGLLNTAQQIGGALGVAGLAMLAATFADTRLPRAGLVYNDAVDQGDTALVVRAQAAMTYGFTRAFIGGAVVFLAAALIMTFVVTDGKRETPSSRDGLGQ